MAKYDLIVLTNPAPGREDEYNDWYTNTHLADVLKVPGIAAAQRFRLSEHQRDPGPHAYNYLAIYHCETDDVRKVIAQLKERSGTQDMVLSDTLDKERMVLFFEPITELKMSGENATFTPSERR